MDITEEGISTQTIYTKKLSETYARWSPQGKPYIFRIGMGYPTNYTFISEIIGFNENHYYRTRARFMAYSFFIATFLIWYNAFKKS